jgi:hypothetical protein
MADPGAPILTDNRAGEGRESKKDALDAVLRAASVGPDLLAMRRAVIQERLLLNGSIEQVPPCGQRCP